MNNQVISYSHEYHLLWRNLKSLTPHVYFLININTRNDKEDTRTSSPTSEKPPKPKDDSSLILLQIYFRYFLFPHNVLPAQLSPQRKGRVAVKQLSKLRRKWSKPLSKHLDLLHKLKMHFKIFSINYALYQAHPGCCGYSCEDSPSFDILPQEHV